MESMKELMNNQLKKPMNQNTIDNLTDALVESMRFCDPTVVYPDLEKAEPDDGVIAEWFYPIYNGTNDFSELTAVLMYTGQETKFEEIGELMLGIGLTEMKHLAKIGDFIRILGGNVEQRYTNSGVELGDTIREALTIAIESEVKTIEFYDSLSNKIKKVKPTKTTKTALEFIAKLVADEEVHKKLLSDALDEYSRRQENLIEKLDDLGNE